MSRVRLLQEAAVAATAQQGPASLVAARPEAAQSAFPGADASGDQLVPVGVDDVLPGDASRLLCLVEPEFRPSPQVPVDGKSRARNGLQGCTSAIRQVLVTRTAGGGGLRQLFGVGIGGAVSLPQV